MVTQIVVGVVVVVLKIPITSNIEDVSELHGDRGYVVSLLVLAVVAAPIWSRRSCFAAWCCAACCRALGPVVAIGLQGLLFGMAHFDPIRGHRQHRADPGAGAGRLRARWGGVPLPPHRPDDDRPRDPQRLLAIAQWRYRPDVSWARIGPLMRRAVGL